MKDLLLRILFESDDIIVADKDRNVPVHGGKGIDIQKTLLFQIKRLLTQRTGEAPEFITPAHRLDQNTQGPVFFAKNGNAAKILNREFSSGGVLKTYFALLEGLMDSTVFVQADIIKDSHKKAVVKNKIMMKENFPVREEWLLKKDKNSLTESATVIFPIKTQNDTTLCKVETWTGRYHQIRAVCEAIGHPVCGDTKYNHYPRDHFHRRINEKFPDGQMLICKRIEIPNLGITVISGFDLAPK